jgi:molybdopterin synthase sulfur carrier subunit
VGKVVDPRLVGEVVIERSVPMPTVFIPSLMQNMTGGKHQIEIEGATVRQIINNLEKEFPGMKERLMDLENNRVKPNISVAVDGEVTTLGMLQKVGENSEVHFLPAIGGGTR